MLSTNRIFASRAFYVSVCSGKGGVGKSTIALLLAARLAQAGRKTLLVDANFGLGDQATLCNAAIKHGIESVLTAKSTLEGSIIQITPRLWLLGTVSGSSLSVSAIQDQGVDQCRLADELFEAVVIDTAASLDPTTINLISASDLAFFVSSPRIPAIADTYIQYKQVIQSNPKLKSVVMINKGDGDVEGDQAATKFVEMVESFLSKKIRSFGSLENNPLIEKFAETQSLATVSAELNGTVKKLDTIVKVLQDQYINKSRLTVSLWESFRQAIPLKSVVSFDDTESTVHI